MLLALFPADALAADVAAETAPAIPPTGPSGPDPRPASDTAFDAASAPGSTGVPAAGPVPPSPKDGSLPSFTLAQIVGTEQEVVEVLELARAAGGTILKPAQHAVFGGFHGYFADPAGFCWEVATNPGWSVDAEGNVSIVPVGDPAG